MGAERGDSPPYVRVEEGGQQRSPGDLLDTPRGFYARILKPLLDRVLGSVLFVLAAPIMVIASVVILMTQGRPIFYTQDRIGLGGKRFRLYKLRTMVPDRRVGKADYEGQERRRTHKSQNDPRVGRAGRALRSLRLDELPQFWNVVIGDMSLVGPRPEMPEIVSTYEPWQHQRHMVKPGVTGPWQISTRNGKLMHECTELDIEYISRLSLLYDLKIIAETPRAMIGNRKGY